MKDIRIALLLPCIVLLSGCQAMEGLVEDLESLELPSLYSEDDPTDRLIYEGRCPRVEVVNDLRSVSEFSDISDKGDYNLISRAVLAKINSACSYEAKSVTVDLKMAFEGTLGPRGRMSATDTPYFSYPFFVAVTSPGGDIMAKEIFSANMTYPVGQNRQTYHENMRQIIPVENQTRGERYKILVGFQLSADQLEFNRNTQRIQQIIEDAEQQRPPVFQQQSMDATQQATQETVNTGAPIDITR